MNRRDVLVNSVSIFGAAALAGSGLIIESTAQAAKPNSILDATSKCISIGLICAAHCRKELATGNKSMAECLATITDTLAACESVQRLAANESKHLKAMAKVCAEICKDCMKACEPHGKHMDICRDCANACKECIDVCLAA
jgi:Cys-rich four helix bundle protein (predicted Tat secretion target)